MFTMYVRFCVVLLAPFIVASFVDGQTDSLNQQWSSYKFPEDWKQMLQGFIHSGFESNKTATLQTPPSLKESFNMEDVDLRDSGCVGPAKSQGSCSSSWAFATTGILEFCACENMKKMSSTRSSLSNYIPLSEQQLLDCATYPFFGKNLGCLGGSVGPALDYAKKFGLLGQAYYPYTAFFGFCDTLKVLFTPPAARVKGIFRLDGDETAIANIVKKQPVAAVITINPDNFVNYKGGIYDDPTCTVTHTNRPCYSVMIVGFGKEKKAYCQGGDDGGSDSSDHDGHNVGCRSGTSPDPDGNCCSKSDKGANGHCCPDGFVVSYGICCPFGNEGDKNRNCCPPAHKDQNGNCPFTTASITTTESATTLPSTTTAIMTTSATSASTTPKPNCNNHWDYDYYWIIKTSFGPSWGEGGYMKLRRGVNMCGIAYDVHYINCI